MFVGDALDMREGGLDGQMVRRQERQTRWSDMEDGLDGQMVRREGGWTRWSDVKEGGRDGQRVRCD